MRPAAQGGRVGIAAQIGRDREVAPPGFGVVVQESHQLLAVQRLLRRELVVAGAACNAGLLRPGNRLRVPGVGGNVGEACAAPGLRTARQGPEHLHQHRAGHLLLGTEAVGGGSSHDPVGNAVINAGVGPVAGGGSIGELAGGTSGLQGSQMGLISRHGLVVGGL